MLTLKISESLSVWSLILYFITLTLICNLKVSESSTIVLSSSGAYSGISVSLSPQLKEESCGATVKTIKNVFHETSKVLQIATSATFEEIIIVIPESWINCDPFQINNTDGLLSWNNADYKVGPKHPTFGDDIWTKQPRGCGMAGDFTYIPYAWLYRTDVRKDSLMLQEWAKFRWGVFEEHGHFVDNVYPESFRDVTGERKPNYCTNEPLVGKFESSCAKAMDCKFEIDSDGNGNICSSIMAVPEIQGVKDFCDDATHLANIPTKQNVICNGKSNKMVINEHADATVLQKIRKTQEISMNPLKVSVVRESRTPSVVIAFETTEAMKKEANQFDFMKESISQFLVYEAPSTAKIGIVSFSDYATVLSGMMKLDPTSRVLLAQHVLKATTSRGKVNLKIAIETAAKTSGIGNGAILLVTKCTDENPNFTVTELVEAANGHSVWIIIYPFISDKYLKTFSELVSVTGGQLQIVDRELSIDESANSLMSPTVRMKLSQSFRQILHLDPIIDMQQVSSTVCSEKVCQLVMDISSSIEPSSELYLYYSITNIVANVNVIEGGSCALEDYGKMKDLIHTTSTLKCTLKENASKLTLMVERQLFYGDLIAELVGHPKYNNTSYDFKIYASSNIYDLKYTETMAPVILIEVTYLGRMILFANVSIEIPFKDTSQVIYMKDDGTGADITGNDGVYSGYLVPILPPGGFYLNISAHDNNYKARLSPESPGSVTPCCGSSIHLPNNLDVAPSFNFSRKFISSRITTSFPNKNLPPGQIKDFTLAGIKSGKTRTVSMTFTAPGADLDYGTASSYILECSIDNSVSKEITLNDSPGASGSRENIQTEIEECDKSYLYKIVAIDERRLRGSPSNMVSVYVPCKAAKGKTSAGTVIGIVFGCFILVALIIVFIFWIRRRKASRRKRGRTQLKVKGPKVVHEEPVPLSNIPTVLETPPPVQVEQIRSIRDLGLQPTIGTLQREIEEQAHEFSLKQVNSSGFCQPDKDDSTSGSHHFEIIVAGDNYLPDSANMNYNNRNIPKNKNYYQKESYSKDSFAKQSDFELYDSQSTLHSSNSTGVSYKESPINQVGIPINPNRVNRSLENLLRSAPPVPPKRFRYYEV